MTEETRLPENGIITANGHYFHHTFADPLTNEEKQALIDNGIDYANAKRFTQAEDALIRDNWYKFAISNNIALENVRMASLVRSKRTNKKLLVHVDFLKFWLAMCEGLPNRSAYQVLSRMYYIYDPAFVSGQDQLVYNTFQRNLMLSTKQLEKVDTMVAKGFNWAYVGKVIGCSLNRGFREHQRWIESNDQISRKFWMKLWLDVSPVSDIEDSDDIGKSPAYEAIRNFCLCENVDSEDSDRIIESMDIPSQAKHLEKPEKAVRNTWLIILKKLRKCIRHERKKFPSLADDILFVRAVNENIKFALLLTFEQMTKFLKIIIQFTKEDGVFGSFSSKRYDIPRIEALMKRRGVTNFYSGNNSEFEYLFRTVSHILYRCHITIYTLLRARYSVKERLSILLESLELQWQLLHQDQDRNMTQQLDFSEFNEKTKIKRKKYIYVKTSYFLDVLVAFTVKRDPKWIPPTKLFKYMIRPETKALFHDQVDNSQLVLKRS